MSENCFWLNYNDVFKWRSNYLESSSVPSGSSCARSVASDIQICMSHLSIFSQNKGGRGSGRRKAPTTFNCDEDISERDLEENDEDIEVSEEWIRFIEEKMRLKAERTANAIKDEKDVPEEARGNIAGSSSTRQDYEKRTKEMQTLYGSSAPSIIGMETAVQLSFNRNVDLHNPPYWPILPFTFKFTP